MFNTLLTNYCLLPKARVEGSPQEIHVIKRSHADQTYGTKNCGFLNIENFVFVLLVVL